jgi:hypothetical protein
MRIYKLGLILFAGWSLFFIPVKAFGLDFGFPGLFWAEARYPNSPVSEERQNYALEGNLEQGVDWISINHQWALNTFGEVRYTVDQEGLDYNNRLSPAVGIKLKAKIGFGMVQLGLKAVDEYRFKSDRSNAIVLGFVNCWFGWNLGGK